MTRTLKPKIYPNSKSSGSEPMVLSFSERKKKIIALIREIPAGQVASYGQVAELAGIPRGARLVVRVLRDPGTKLPWWRVLRSDGSCALDGQLERLRGEGVIAEKRVDMQRYRWQGLDYLLFGESVFADSVIDANCD